MLIVRVNGLSWSDLNLKAFFVGKLKGIQEGMEAEL